ncbi:hypothetical protein V1264_015860 [Littorina saxatilis]|uniref:Uncharacterized protein n=1 Tax=Littorina saxatilis TaxID=31220 RepID=A0AAN9BMR5_9CAEN
MSLEGMSVIFVVRELSSILGVNVTVDTIFPGSSEGSRVFISAKNTTTWEPLPKAKLQSLVEEKSAEIASLWDRYRQSMTPVPDTNDSDFSPLIIVLIVLSVVFLLAFIVAVAFVCRFHKSGRRQQRLIQRLTGVNDLYANTAALGKAENGDASLTTNIEITDDDAAEGIGIINPVFIDESEQNSPADTPRSAFDEGGEAEVTESTRLPDADSGVPSDRENGMDSDSSKETTPVMRRSEGGSPSSRGGSAYLHAVLMTSEDDVNDGADDMIDVTAMSPSDNDVTGPESERFSPLDDPEPDYVDARSNPPPDAIVDPSTGNYEEQENTMTFTDTSEDLSLDTTLQPTHGSHDAELQPVDTGRHPDMEEEDEDVGVVSKLAMLMRPSTPPMIHRPSKKEEEEEEEENLPEEPEPDYAKKVRFRVRVTEHVNPQNEGEHPAEVTGGDGEGRGDDDGGREEVDPASPEHASESSEHTENVAHPEEKNDPEKPHITEEDAKTAFNTEEETTSF